MTQHGLSYEPRAPTNVEPTPPDHFVKLGKIAGPKLHKVNYSSIAQAADLSEASLMYILKQVILAVESCIRKDYFVKLNLRVGFLKFKHQSVMFDNLVTYNEIKDQLTQTSCGTVFRANK